MDDINTISTCKIFQKKVLDLKPMVETYVEGKNHHNILHEPQEKITYTLLKNNDDKIDHERLYLNTHRSNVVSEPVSFRNGRTRQHVPKMLSNAKSDISIKGSVKSTNK